MSGDDHTAPDGDDVLFQRLFARAAVQQPSQAQLERWEQHLLTALRGARGGRRTALLTAGAAACVAAAALALWLTWVRSPPAEQPVVATVRSAFGGNVVREGDVVRGLGAGSAVHDGERVETGLRSGLGLRYRTAQVRLDAGTTVVFNADRLDLKQGTLYLDVPPVATGRPGEPLEVATTLGTFSHAGTQFLVSVSSQGVWGAVREGAIVLHQESGEIRIAAQDGHGRKVAVDASGEVRESEVPTTGPLWAWTLRTSPGIVVAGRSPDDVLSWIARERGQRLVYADPRTRQVARDKRLSGGAVSLSTEDALDTVRSSTRLRIDSADPAEIRVALESEGDQNADGRDQGQE